MLDNKGFSLWADGYDESVDLCDESNDYPFAGYKEVLNEIYCDIHKLKNAKILDIGFGTGTLTTKLYNDGYDIWGIDFFEKMIEIAKKKMINAKLYCYDFTKGLPSEIENEKFDFIISTYALHHLTDDKKIEFLHKLIMQLNENSVIMIGDVAFETRNHLENCKKNYGDNWDEDEYYFVFEDLKNKFANATIMFKQISFCAGIIKIIKI